MSDPAWASRTIIRGSDSKIWIQTAGTATAVGDSDLLGFITKFDYEIKSDVKEKGPYVNLATIKKTLSSYSISGTIAVDIADGTDAVREMFFTAIANKSRLKITVQLKPTTGPKDVFDQAIVDVKSSIDPAEGGTYEFAFACDNNTHTAASA